MTTLTTVASTATATDFLLQHLRAEGYQAQTDSDGDIVFRFEGMGYVLCLDADDIQFGKLLLPNVWPIESPQEQQRVLVALDEVNRRIKLVKGHLVRGQVWSASRCCCSSRSTGRISWRAPRARWPMQPRCSPAKCAPAPINVYAMQASAVCASHAASCACGMGRAKQ